MYTTATKSNKQYLADKVKTASPLELVVLLYDAALSALEIVPELWKDKEFFIAGEKIIKAQKCIRELKRALDLEKGGDIAANLHALYRVMDNTLTEAGREKNPEKISVASNMLSGLRESWATLLKQNAGTEQIASDIAYINMYK